MPVSQKFSHDFHQKVFKLPKKIRCLFRNVKRFQKSIWLLSGQILRALAYFKQGMNSQLSPLGLMGYHISWLSLGLTCI